MEAGDIIFVITEKKHEVFKRSGIDLIMEQKIPLIEALAGFSFVFTHLDGRQIMFKTAKGDVINHGMIFITQLLMMTMLTCICEGDIRTLEGEGMPTHKRPFDKGNMYIQFTVEFPKPGSLSKSQLDQLEKILPPRRPVPKVTDEMEQQELKPFSESQRRASARKEAYNDDDDDEGHPGAQRVQCAQQ